MAASARRSRRRFRLGAPLIALALTSLALASVQCGLLAPPGEYASGGVESAETSTETSTSTDATTTPDVVTLPDGAVAPANIGTIAVMAGQRDPAAAGGEPSFSADAWSAIIGPDGRIASWRIEQAATSTGAFETSSLVGTTWLMLNTGLAVGGGRSSALQATSWSPGIAGDWKTAVAGGAPGGLAEPTRALFGNHVVYVGGTRTNPGVDGGPATTFFVNEVHVADVDVPKNVLGSSADSGQQLTLARSRAGVLFNDGSLYVVGGRSAGGFIGSVEMALADTTTGGIQAFADQPTLMNAGAEHKIFFPSLVVAGGYLFVAGGRTSFANAPTDVVLSAKIGDGGTLGAFQNVTNLPVPLRDFAFVSFKDRLYVAGGVTATGRSDQAYSAVVTTDGKLSAWGTDAKLPAARSDFVALAY